MEAQSSVAVMAHSEEPQDDGFLMFSSMEGFIDEIVERADQGYIGSEDAAMAVTSQCNSSCGCYSKSSPCC